MGYKKILAETSRVILGLTFIFSGTVKAIDPVGGAFKIEDYFGAFGLSALNPVALIVSANLCAIEFVLGVCILTAVYRKISSVCILVFMAFMTLLTLYLAIFNPVHDCGCFGDAIIITNWQTFFKNALILLPASIAVFIWHKKMTPLYSEKAQWFVPVFAYLCCIAFSYYNYSHLPIKDFRPYKIGANIPEQMSFPQDAPQDEYAYIYEKDGVKQAFTPENIPDKAEGWKFAESKLIKQGYVPPITSFELYNSDGDNIAEDILSEENGVFLLISPDISKADDKRYDKINRIYEYANERNIPFYCVTGSGKEAVQSWIINTGADYPFLTADDVTLKTIIRSNPGLVLLKSGVVLAKWHFNDLPAPNVVNSVIEPLLNYPDNKNDEENNLWIRIIGIFVIPLLLVWIYDFFINRKRK